MHLPTYLPTYLPKHMPYPTLPYPNLSYPTTTPLPPHSHPTPSKHVLNSLSKHIAYLTLSNPALPRTAVPWPTPPLSTLRPARPTWRHFRSFGTPRPIPWIKLIHGIGRGVPNALSVFVCAHFNPSVGLRSERSRVRDLPPPCCVLEQDTLLPESTG